MIEFQFMIEKGTDDLETISVSLNLFSKAKIRQSGTVGTEGLKTPKDS